MEDLSSRSSVALAEPAAEIPARPATLIELRGAAKGFGPASARSEVLAGLDLQVQEGEFLAIVGFSGSGKTTLINLLAGLHRPDTGEALFDGRSMPEAGPDRALVFQNYSLLPWLTVFGNVALAVDRVFPDWPAERRQAHVERHIAMVNLSAARDKRPRQLSGGMRQRVAVARALSMDPRVLLLDEPLGALDALTRATLQDEISRIWQENRKTVVLITNDPDEAILLADRVIPLSAGPRATLGPSFAVDLPRPRNRKTLNHDASFKRLRKEILDWLLASAGARSSGPQRTFELPSVRPENLENVRWLDRLFRRGTRAGGSVIRRH
ncbi:nitrate ABC transporter ATP-binding protein [Opitutaceae bacterium EW11]|nr:nitrate ABC transporter ATP-binding protein [Opitutaceae bacterium EW11]